MSIGSFLKRATTIPSHGPLSGLRKVFGETPLDEIGAVGGFVLGGPAGAAAGAGLGSVAHNQDLGDAVGNAVKYGAAGYGASALGVPGGNALGLSDPLAGLGAKIGLGGSPTAPPPAVMDTFNPVPGGAQAFGPLAQTGGAPSTLAGLGGQALRGIGSFLKGNNGMNALATAGLAANVYGAKKQGDAEDEQIGYQRERAARFDPQREKLMEIILSRLARTGGQ